MFDFGFGELLLLGVIALVVLGPERLPVAARLLGRWIRTTRSQWNSVKAELENEIADDELRRNLREVSDAMRQGAQQMRGLHEDVAASAARMSRIATPAPISTEPASAELASIESASTVPSSRSASEEPTVAVDLPSPDPAQLSLLPHPHSTTDEPTDRPRSDG